MGLRAGCNCGLTPPANIRFAIGITAWPVGEGLGYQEHYEVDPTSLYEFDALPGLKTVDEAMVFKLGEGFLVPGNLMR